MRYKKLSLINSPSRMNSDLENYYGYGLYEFSSVLALITYLIGIYDPYSKNKIIKGNFFLLRKNLIYEIFGMAEDFYEAIDTYKKGDKIRTLTIKKAMKKLKSSQEEFISENRDYKIGLYMDNWDIAVPTKVFKNYQKKEENIIEDLIFNNLIWRKWQGDGWNIIRAKIKPRDRVVGVWAKIMRDKKGIHWDNISNLLNWFLEKFPQSIQEIFGDTHSDVIKKQYLRKREFSDFLFDVIQLVCFPKKRKKPVWIFWFGENYIMWISPKICTTKHYNWLKNKINEIEKNETTDPYEFFRKKKNIALHELKKFFNFCHKNRFSKPPFIIFPNGQTFP